MDVEQKEGVQRRESSAERKKTYRAPKLTLHGSIEDVTGLIGLKGADGTLGSVIDIP